MGKEKVSSFVNWLSRAMLLLLYVMALLALPAHEKRIAMILLQLILGSTIFWRFKSRRQLAFIPDEMLVLMPYLWSLNVLWHISALNQYMHAGLFFCFAISLLQVSNGKYGFKGGLRGNDLLLSIYCSLVFAVSMAVFVRHMLPFFSLQMFRSSMFGIYGYLAGIPISLSAFYQLLPVRTDASNNDS